MTFGELPGSAWVGVAFGERLGGAWVSVTFGELLGSAWVSMTFGELLLHWAGSERRAGTGARRRVCGIAASSGDKAAPE